MLTFVLKVYNDYISKKIKKPRLSSDGLKGHVNALSDLLTAPYLSLRVFSVFKKAIEALLSAFYQYKEYLEKHCNSVTAAHKLPSIDLNPDKTSVITLAASKEISEIYVPLAIMLQEKPPYTVVFLQDYLPTDRFQRRQWLQKLKVPCSAMMYTYAHGNSFGNLYFIWKCGKEIDHTQVNQAILQVSTKLPVFASRDAQMSFVEKYSHLSKVPKSVLRSVYNTLTGNQTVAPTGMGFIA